MLFDKNVESLAEESPNRLKVHFLLGLSVLLGGIGFVLCPSFERIGAGILKILIHPSMTDFDSFFWSEEFGASFVQAGLCVLLFTLFYITAKADIGGNDLATAMMVTGFAFYGKNILNIWFPIAGVFLSSLVTKKPIKSLLSLGFSVACIAPVFSTVAFGTQKLGYFTPVSITLGVALGVLGGFLSGIFADYGPYLHYGLLLYNAGMAAGWGAIIVNSLLKAIGLGHEAYPYADSYTTGKNQFFLLILTVIFGYIISFGIINKGWKGFKKMFWSVSEKPILHEEYGFGACLINMGVAGLLATAYVLAVGGELNGVMFACIFATAGFSGFGSTVRMQLPILLGVFTAAIITGGISGVMVGESFIVAGMAKVATRGMILSALFTCGVAPIVGKFGNIAGFVVGLIHCLIVTNTGVLHGWMSLYNNGFSFGLVTTFLYPLYSRLQFARNVNRKRIN